MGKTGAMQTAKTRSHDFRIACRSTLTHDFQTRTLRLASGCATVESPPTLFGDSLPPVRLTETEHELRIKLPLGGLDLRHVYVFASPRCIVVESRSKTSIAHAAVCATEVQDERIIRELKLHINIKEGSTRVRILGDELEITCTKAQAADDCHWSESLRLDTRASLGCV